MVQLLEQWLCYTCSRGHDHDNESGEDSVVCPKSASGPCDPVKTTYISQNHLKKSNIEMSI